MLLVPFSLFIRSVVFLLASFVSAIHSFIHLHTLTHLPPFPFSIPFSSPVIVMLFCVTTHLLYAILILIRIGVLGALPSIPQPGSECVQARCPHGRTGSAHGGMPALVHLTAGAGDGMW